jgi:hypothetical protein
MFGRPKMERLSSNADEPDDSPVNSPLGSPASVPSAELPADLSLEQAPSALPDLDQSPSGLPDPEATMSTADMMQQAAELRTIAGEGTYGFAAKFPQQPSTPVPIDGDSSFDRFAKEVYSRKASAKPLEEKTRALHNHVTELSSNIQAMLDSFHTVSNDIASLLPPPSKSHRAAAQHESVHANVGVAIPSRVMPRFEASLLGDLDHMMLHL